MHTLQKAVFTHKLFKPFQHTLCANGAATSANADHWLTYSLDYNGPAVLVPHTAIEAALKADKKATLSPDGSALLVAGMSISFETYDVSEFPPVPIVDGPEYNVTGFAAALKQVSYAMALNDIRYYLNSVCLDVTDSTIDVVATDWHRMAWVSLAYVPGLPVGQYIIPREAVKHCAGDVVRLSKEYLQCGGLGTKLIDGNYPDWRRVVPKPSQVATIDTAALLKALTTLAPFVDKKHKGCKLEFSKSGISVTAGEAVIVAPAVCSLDSCIGFCITYLIDVLKASKEVVTTVAYTDSTSSILINDRAVVMPMRL